MLVIIADGCLFPCNSKPAGSELSLTVQNAKSQHIKCFCVVNLSSEVRDFHYSRQGIAARNYAAMGFYTGMRAYY